MGINLHHTLEDVLDDNGNRLYDIPQLNYRESREILGDRVHERICDRLEDYYKGWIREIVEEEAHTKGVKNPWTSKDHVYYENRYAGELRDNVFMRRLRNLRKVPASGIKWYLL